MKKFALIEQGFVKDLFIADEARVLELMFPDSLVIEETQKTGAAFIGGGYEDGVFMPPQPKNNAEYDANAIDGDDDGRVQDGTPFEREAGTELSPEEVTATEAVADQE
jgi:hypothetical protein